MNINDMVHGFQVVRVRDLPDAKGTLYELEHRKTGAQLAWLKRDESNKTFSITFKTIPENDTGVFHMLEHSVLNGSVKYPVREPFVELLKGSMQTFLNAFTFPDKTMYPVSSRNDKDFMNLMSVYMDAVFHPLITENPNIFYQEGWHYEIRNKEDEPSYKGVVLNEMKGAFSNVDEIVINELNRMLFPDNCYQYVSGGDPEHIVDLSYEEFLANHKKFYHPSNARVFLDGDMDIEAVLSFIDGEYFSHYEKEEMSFDIPVQEVKPVQLHKIPYELGSDEPTEHRTQIAMGRIVSSFDDVEKNLAWNILGDVLTSSNESPLPKAIIENDLGENFELDVYSGIQQPWIIMNVRNTDEEKYEEIRKVLQKTFHELIHGGLDHHAIIAGLNQAEFRYREKSEPAGVMYAQRVMASWLYDGDPAIYLSQGELFEQLRKKCEEGYFEELLEELYPEDCEIDTVIAYGDTGLGQVRVEKEQNRLHEAKVSWGDEIERYIEANLALDKWQMSSDTQEQLDTLPKLSLSDVSREVRKYNWKEESIRGVPAVIHECEDPNIVYMNLYFSLAGIRREDLSALSMYAGLFTNLRTKNRTLEELHADIREYTGSLGFGLDSFAGENEYDSTLPVLTVSCSTLKKNLDYVIDLILDIIQETVYEKDAILPLLKQNHEDFRQMMAASGHGLALSRVSAHCSAEGVFREFTGGYSFGKYMKELLENFDTEADAFLNDCALFTEILFSRDRMTVSINAEDRKDAVERLIDSMHTVEGMRARMHYPLLDTGNECIVIPGGVSYAAFGSNPKNEQEKYDAGISVASHLLTYDYLWNEVRVKGGAYGTGCTVSMVNTAAFYSYRDPDPANSLAAFRKAGEHLRKLAEENADIESMVIGTIASGEPLLSPAGKIARKDGLYFRGITEDTRKHNRERILSMNAEELGKPAAIMDRTAENGIAVVVGSEEALSRMEGFTELEKI